jgi:hypothetical protein
MVDVQTGPREAVRAGLLLRVLPPGLYAGMPGRVMARSALVTWRKWPIFVSGFAEPLLYLFAFQIGFSALVSDEQQRLDRRFLRKTRHGFVDAMAHASSHILPSSHSRFLPDATIRASAQGGITRIR